MKIDINKIVIVSIFILSISMNITWILLNEDRLLTSDESVYALASIDIYAGFQKSFGNGLYEIIHAIENKAPAISWIGSLLIPLGIMVNNISLIISFESVIFSFLSLFMMYKIGEILFPRKILSQILLLLFIASAPLFVGLSRLFFVEIIQLFVIIAFLYLYIASEKFQSFIVVMLMIFLFFLALIVKISTIIYICPVIIAILVKEKNRILKIGIKDFFIIPFNYLFIIILVLFCGLVSLWYYTNLSRSLELVAQSTSSNYSLLWGTARPFYEKILYWMRLSSVRFYIPYVNYFVIVCGIIGLIKWVVVKNKFHGLFFVSISSIIISILIYSFQLNEVDRFLLPLLPFYSIFFVSLIDNINLKIFNILSILFLIIQFSVINLYVFRVFDLKYIRSATVVYPYRDEAFDKLRFVVNETCFDGNNVVFGIHGSISIYTASLFKGINSLSIPQKCSFKTTQYLQSDFDAAKNLVDNSNFFITRELDQLIKHRGRFWNGNSYDLHNYVSVNNNFIIYRKYKDIIIFRSIKND